MAAAAADVDMTLAAPPVEVLATGADAVGADAVVVAGAGTLRVKHAAHASKPHGPHWYERSPTSMVFRHTSQM